MKKCKICKKSVYPVDPQVNLDGTLFHKSCAKCEDCACQITTTNFRKYEDKEDENFVTLVCIVHYNARIVDRGHLWYTSQAKERERIAAQAALIDAARRRESLHELSGKNIVGTNSSSYSSSSVSVHDARSPGSSSNAKVVKKWPPPSPKAVSTHIAPPAATDGAGDSEKDVSHGSLKPFASAPEPPDVAASDPPQQTEEVTTSSDKALPEYPAEEVAPDEISLTAEPSGVVSDVVSAEEVLVEEVADRLLTNSVNEHTALSEVHEDTDPSNLSCSVGEQNEPAEGNGEPGEPSDDLTSEEIITLKQYQADLSAADREHGPTSAHSIAMAERLGTDCKRKRLYSCAQFFYREVLKRREQALGDKHLETIDGVSMLADLYHKMKKLKESAVLYRRALYSREQVQGLEHEATLYEVNDLATVCVRLGEYIEAEQLYNRCLNARERVCGPTHEDTLITVHDYAALLEELGRLEEAELMYARAVNGREAVLGPEHADTLDSITCLALVLQNLGKDAEAEAMYLRAMDASERAHGPADKHTCDLAYNLGNMYEDQLDWCKAVEMYEYALNGYTQALGAEDEETCDCRAKLVNATARKASP